MLSRSQPTTVATKHWGQWVRARAAFVGIKNFSRLAGELGCARQHLCRWLGMPTPPTRMCKGLDMALLRSLKTDRPMLFNNFKQVAADDAPLVEESPERPGDELRAEIKLAIESMAEPGGKKAAGGESIDVAAANGSFFELMKATDDRLAKERAEEDEAAAVSRRFVYVPANERKAEPEPNGFDQLMETFGRGTDARIEDEQSSDGGST